MDTHDRNQYLLSAAALGMSALAMVFAFMELRSSDRQLDADVWPYVDLSIALNSDRVAIELSNKGSGPALVYQYEMLLAGEAIDRPRDLLERSGYGLSGMEMSFSSAPDTVLGVGETVTALRIEGEGVGPVMAELARDLDIRICYCSITGTCWNNDSEGAFRAETPSCSIQDQNTDILIDQLFPNDDEAEAGDAGTGDGQ